MNQGPLLQLSQTLQLSSSLLQSMEILQQNTLELAQYLNNLALENPVLEYTEGSDSALSWEAFSQQVPWLKDTPAPGEPGTDPGGLAVSQNTEDSLSLLLGQQLDRLSLRPPLLALCQYLIELLDPHGRLEQEDLDGLTHAGVPASLLEEAITTLQSLDPAGVGARSTEECLVLQLSRLPGDHTLAAAICQNHLELAAKEDYKRLAALLHAPVAQVEAACDLIRTLNPNPVGDMAEASPEPVSYVRPDAWVVEINGALQVYVNQWDLPQFHLSQDYLAMAGQAPNAETAEYLQQKIRQARWVLQCVQRRHATMQQCFSALVQGQTAFFLGQQAAPSPLLRRDLAEQLSLHPSTITRTLRHKYLQCRQGLFPTSYFFSTPRGNPEQGYSVQDLHLRLSQMIAQENPQKPYSDTVLAKFFQDQSITLSRRTIAKYRQALGIPSSYARRAKKSEHK